VESAEDFCVEAVIFGGSPITALVTALCKRTYSTLQSCWANCAILTSHHRCHCCINVHSTSPPAPLPACLPVMTRCSVGRHSVARPRTKISWMKMPDAFACAQTQPCTVRAYPTLPSARQITVRASSGCRRESEAFPSCSIFQPQPRYLFRSHVLPN
jgi:hypothetical protein